MSDSDSSSSSSITDDYDLEVENNQLNSVNNVRERDDDSFEVVVPYADEPIADEEWIVRFEEERQREDEIQFLMQQRLHQEVPVNSWCKCGLCDVRLLANPMECYCCRELEGCDHALEDELVLSEMGNKPQCVTLHPGFNPCCLETWSLRLAGTRYRKRDKSRYKKTGTEEAFLRAVAYREFTQLIYGQLGKKRIPLPACAYNKIRGKFKTDEELVGFMDLED